jgi:hypothetical protein
VRPIQTRLAIGLMASLLCFLPRVCHSQPATGLTTDDGLALIHAVRAVATPDYRFVPTPKAPALDQPDKRTLIVTLYDNGPSAFQSETSAATLREAATQAGDLLLKALGGDAKGKSLMQRGRICVDVVLASEPIASTDRFQVGSSIKIGREGISYKIKGNKAWLTPIALLRQSRELDILKSACLERKIKPPPRKVQMRSLRTYSVVEIRAGGVASELVNGNTLLPPKPSPADIARAAFDASLWLVGAQRDDGSFIISYSPTRDKMDIHHDYDVEAHIRATLALTEIYMATRRQQFQKARAKALKHVGKYLQSHPRLGLLYVHQPKRGISGNTRLRRKMEDDPVSTALLLTTLCSAILRQKRPTADGDMRQLGNYLCKLVDNEGGMHPSLESALRNEKGHARIVTGVAYAEAIIALCLLERISPREHVRKTIERLVAYATAFREASPPAVPRTIEALGQAYIVTRKPKLGQSAFELGLLLLRAQLWKKTAKFPDEMGGFPEADQTPQTFSVAQALSAMSTAYHLGRSIKLEAPKTHTVFPVPVRFASAFIMNMQFRRENSFYLARPGISRGGFRKGTNDLTLQVRTTADAISALLKARLVVSELVQSRKDRELTRP